MAVGLRQQLELEAQLSELTADTERLDRGAQELSSRVERLQREEAEAERRELARRRHTVLEQLRAAEGNGGPPSPGVDATVLKAHDNEFWSSAVPPEQLSQGPCAICLGEMTNAERTVVRLGCSHCFHLSCVSKCVVAGCLSCPLCRTQTFSAPRARAIEAASEGDAAAAAIAAAAGRHRARLEQRLEQRRVDRRTFRRRHGV